MEQAADNLNCHLSNLKPHAKAYIVKCNFLTLRYLFFCYCFCYYFDFFYLTVGGVWKAVHAKTSPKLPVYLTVSLEHFIF